MSKLPGCSVIRADWIISVRLQASLMNAFTFRRSSSQLAVTDFQYCTYKLQTVILLSPAE